MDRSERRSLPGDERWTVRLDGRARAMAVSIGLRSSGLEPSAFVTLTLNGRLKVCLAPAPGVAPGWRSHPVPAWTLHDGDNVFDAHLYSHVNSRNARLERLIEFAVVLAP